MARKKERLCADDEQLYEVTVWDDEGDIVKKLWRATAADLDYIEQQYDEPWRFTVIAEPI